MQETNFTIVLLVMLHSALPDQILLSPYTQKSPTESIDVYTEKKSAGAQDSQF